MNVQHAPSPVQSARVAPNSEACVTLQRNSGGTISTASTTTMMVSAVFSTDPKRLRRDHSIASAPRVPGVNMR